MRLLKLLSYRGFGILIRIAKWSVFHYLFVRLAGQVQIDRGFFLSNFFEEVFNYLSFFVYVNQDF